MLQQYDRPLSSPQAAPHVAALLRQHRTTFLAPLVQPLDHVLDARFVRTLVATVSAILVLRHRQCGVLLSELGASIRSPAHAPAGTKRRSNLLRSPKWSADSMRAVL